MRVESWEQLGLDQRRAAAFVLVVAAAVFAVVAAVGLRLHIGSVSAFIAVMAGATAGYLAFTAPRRTVRTAAFRQTLEAPPFAASSNIYLKSTGSRSKTLLLLRAEEALLGSFLADVRRTLLLGYDAASAAKAARPENRLFSESVRTVVDSVVGVDKARVEEGSDELDGMLNSSGLEEETKLPMFIAVAFFLPIMLMLFAATTKGTSPAAMAALVVLEVVVLDLTLAFSGSTVGWGRAARR